MDFYTTSSASSPFSQLSTDASSPEANTSAGETKTPPPAQMYGNEMMQTVNSNFNQAYGNMLDIKPQLHDVKPQINGGMTMQNGQSAPPPSAFARVSGHQSVASSSRAPSSHGGARADKPTRKYPIEDIPTATPSVDELYTGPTSKGLVLLQGDPQAITKQRVETAIRAIIDLLHFVPPSVAPLPTDTNVLSLLPRGPDGRPQAHLARIGTFKTLRLQAGTTTKQMSKKQEQMKEQAKKGVKDPSALDASTVYLETAVYKSDGQTRVYACKRCRGREEKRRKSKESSRKNPVSSDAARMSSSSPRQPKSQSSPSPDYVTGENAEEYDPMRVGQIVQEPTWNPDVADWRHEIIMFNNSPEMAIKEPGTVDWLPFRVVCYGKCHGEKTGFRIKFIIRTRDGRILGSDMTDPIRITDDHKTDKAKPRLEMSRTAPVARSRKGTSAMSSRRTSPAASDDSLQSFSEAGAVVQKQALHSRSKPYERPSVARHHSSSSIHSAASMSALPTNTFPDVPPSSAEWPNILNQPQQPSNNINLRRPFPGTMTPLNGDALSFTTSNPPSVHSSAVQSPISLQPMLDHDDIPNELASRFSALGQSLGQTQPMSFPVTNPMLFDGMDGFNGQFNSMPNDGQDLFSASSYTSSFASDHSGLGLYNADSVFSDSGLRPESTDDENDQMMNYLTIPDGVDTLSQPFGFPSQSTTSAPLGNMGNVPAPMGPAVGMSMPTAAPIPQAPAPMISAVIPPNGPMSGGPDIAIIGMNLPPGAVVLFGGRPAETKASNPAVVQCILPPGISPGQVEVTIQGYGSQAVSGLFTYDGVTKEAMQLALDVKGHYPSNSNPAQLPNTFQQNTGNGSWASSNPPTDEDLQTTLTNYLASIDQHAPGSMRHSGSINTRNAVQQTLLHLSTILGYHRLLRRLIVYGAKLDVQDINGFTPLAFAAYSGQLDCARVLIEAGATYDIPTNLGELPLDLAKISGDHAVEQLLLSAVWSTRSAPASAATEEAEVEDDVEVVESDHSELDNDNPSDTSEDEAEVDAFIDRPPRRRRSKHQSRRPKIFMPDDRSIQANPADSIRRTPSTTDTESLADGYPSTPSGPSHIPQAQTQTRAHGPNTSPPPSGSVGIDSPPPYSPASWLDRLPLNTEQWRFPLVPHPIASMFHPKSASPASAEAGWVTLPVPAPSWETLQRMTSPEEVKLFTQAMAAAALNAVVQSGATTTMEPVVTRRSRERERRKKRRSSGSGSAGAPPRSSGGSPGAGKVVKQVKKDRMLLFFWLPILLFFGFWIVVTALPIITGFGLIYARSITRYIKQRM